MEQKNKTPIKVVDGGVTFLAKKFKVSRKTIYSALNNECDTIRQRLIRKEAQKDYLRA